MKTPAKESQGRPIGSPNKITAEVRKAFGNLIAKNLRTMEKDLASLKPKERLEIIIAMARFVVPMMRSIEVNAEAQGSPFPSFSIRIDEMGGSRFLDDHPATPYENDYE